MRRLTAVLLTILILLIALGALIVLRWVQDIPDELLAEAEFSAAISDQGGVDVSSAFLLQFPENVSAASVNRALQVEPEITLGVHQGSSRNEVLLSPAEPLQPDTQYTFTISSEEQSYQWAFQTKSPLQVVETHPQAQEIGVAVNAALEFVLDQMLDVDLELLASSVRIFPETEGSFSQNGRVIRFQPTQGWLPATVYTVEINAIPLLASDVELVEPCSFSFETAAAAPSRWYVEGESAFLPEEKPVFRAWISDQLLFDRFAALSASADASSSDLASAEMAALTVQAKLYHFTDAADYADALLAMAWQDPYWGDPLLTRTGNTEKAVLEKTTMLQLSPQADGSFHFEWPEHLADGHYLLRVTYLNQSCDLFFSVSALSAWMTADSGQTLFWLHDTSTGDAADGAQVTDWQASISKHADRSGLVQLEREADIAVYLIEDDNRTLVLPLTRTPEEEEEAFTTWRYLYTDQAAYQNGDTLYFWGLVQPRDGSELEYERVSVYIYPAEGGEEVWFGYAPLTGDVFSGSVALPQLLSGTYSLQIWQSGRLLVAREFTVGDASVSLAEPLEDDMVTPAVLPSLLLEPEGGFRSGESFAATFPQADGECLFLELAGGIVSAAAGGGNLYLGEFSPQNGLNSYLAAVCFDGQDYWLSAASLLPLAVTDCALQLSLACEPAISAGEAQTVTITVQDAAGTPVSGAAVALQLITGGSQPEADPLSAIYGDYQGSGMLEWPSASDDLDAESAGETVFFLSGTTDAEGVFVAEIPALAVMDSNGWLLTQAVCGGMAVQAGAACQPILLRGDVPLAEEDAAQPAVYTLESGILADEKLFSDDGSSSLIVLSGEERFYWISLLLKAAAAGCNTGETSVASPAAYAAGQQLLDMFGDTGGLQNLVRLLSDQPLQTADGSIGTLQESVFIAALDLPGVSESGLRMYFNSILRQDSDRLSQIQALTGLAACGDSVLNELKQMLAQTSLQVDEMLWLCWGLCLSGDIQPGLRAGEQELAMTEQSAAWQVAAVLAAGQGKAEAARQAITNNGGEESLAAVAAASLLLPQLQQQQSGLSYGDGEQMHATALLSDGELLYPLSAGDTLRFETEDTAIWYGWLRAWPQPPDMTENRD